MNIRRLATAFAPAALFTTAAAWVLRDAPGRAVGEGVDLPGTLWYHAWVADCVRHLRWPGWTPWFFHPDGKDLFAHTGANLLDALLAVPFLAVFGTPDHFAPFALAVLVGNGLAAYALARAMALSRPASIASGLVFVLAPSALSELDGGRVTQVLLWFWPLALRELWLDRVDPRPARLARAGLFVALQGYTYWFTGHFFAVVFGVPLLIGTFFPIFFLGRGAGPAVALNPATPPAPSNRAARARALGRLVLAGLVAVVIVAPAVVPMTLRLLDGTVPVGEGLTLGVRDARGPDAWWILAPHRSQLVVSPIVLALFGAGLLLARRRAFWGLAGLLGVLLVAGDRLYFAFGALPNPAWELGRLLPGFDRLLFPARAWSAVALVGAMAVGEAVDRLGRYGVVALVAVAGGMLAARPQPVHTTPIEVPAYVAAVKAAPGPVLDLPVPCGQMVIHLQPLHGQPMLGGMAEHIGPLVPGGPARWTRDAGVAAIVQAALGRPAPAQALGERVDAHWIVLHEAVLASPLARGTCLRGIDIQPGAARRELERLLGPPTVADGLAVAWNRRSALARDAPAPPGGGTPRIPPD